MNIEEKFTQFIKTQNLEDEKILLMVSGGVDSMVLLDVASKVVKPSNIAIFHLDHGLREDSYEDLKFVQDICSTKNLKFYSEQLIHPDKKDLGGEAQWRLQRQKLSAKASQEFGAKVILTAHHATDLVETMIFRLTKGCGVSGLSPFDKNTKPFWDISKSELIDYAEKNELEWREDSSNQNTDFQRNLIRQNILPQLRKITPNLEKVFVKESIIFEEIQDFLDKQTKIKDESIKLKSFQSLPPIIQREFLRKISKKTPSFNEVEDCLKWLVSNPEGNSQKKIGDTEINLKQNVLIWK